MISDYSIGKGQGVKRLVLKPVMVPPWFLVPCVAGSYVLRCRSHGSMRFPILGSSGSCVAAQDVLRCRHMSAFCLGESVAVLEN